MNQKFCKSIASAIIRGGNQTPSIFGKVNFQQKQNYVLVTAHIRGLPETPSGFFGFHIHEGENCNGTDFANTLNHYNPENSPHPTHAGDLPPLMYCGGVACQSFITDRFCVKDIIGRTIVIHDMPDDFNSQPSGNAGKKIACGVICGGQKLFTNKRSRQQDKKGHPKMSFSVCCYDTEYFSVKNIFLSLNKSVVVNLHERTYPRAYCSANHTDKNHYRQQKVSLEIYKK